jgi:hypothetical protein
MSATQAIANFAMMMCFLGGQGQYAKLRTASHVQLFIKHPETFASNSA